MLNEELERLRNWWRVKKLFKGMTIKLTEPICDCQEENLRWCLPDDTILGRRALKIECDECKCSIFVSHERMRATFVLDKPYPGKPVPTPTPSPTPPVSLDTRPPPTPIPGPGEPFKPGH